MRDAGVDETPFQSIARMNNQRQEQSQPQQVQQSTNPNHHSGDHSPCTAAAEADRKVEVLGNDVVNPLEKRVADLEDLDLEQRVDTLYQRQRPYEEYRTLAEDQVKKLRQTEEVLRTKKDELELAVKSEVQKQGLALEDVVEKLRLLQEQVDQQNRSTDQTGEQASSVAVLQARVVDLERRSTLQSHDANTLGLDLLCRLQGGESMHPALTRQLKLILTGGKASEDSTNRSDQTSAQARGGSTSTGGTPTAGVPKRRGRPLKHGRYARNITADEMKVLLAASHRRESVDSIPSVCSLSTTPSADVPSTKSKTSAPGTGTKAAADKIEVPETQPEEDDMEMDDAGAMSDLDCAMPFIPGERKSGRMPKPRRFADQVGWAEANKAVRRLKPSSPQKGRY